MIDYSIDIEIEVIVIDGNQVSINDHVIAPTLSIMLQYFRYRMVYAAFLVISQIYDVPTQRPISGAFILMRNFASEGHVLFGTAQRHFSHNFTFNRP